MLLHFRVSKTIVYVLKCCIKLMQIGYIGGQATDVSEPVAVQLTRLGIVQISYSSTNPVLSDQTKYPYFMRIVPPDNVQATAMIDVVQGASLT